MSGSDSDRETYNKAMSYETAVAKYKSLMEETIRTVNTQIEILLQDYETISNQIEEFWNASEQEVFQVRCELSGLVKIPDSGYGEQLRVFFLESTSEQAR